MNGPVAQSGRAPPLQGGGLGFKSRRVHLSAAANLIRGEERRKSLRWFFMRLNID